MTYGPFMASTIMLRVLASKSINADKANGLIHGVVDFFLNN